jgi:hypothetical protein
MSDTAIQLYNPAVRAPNDSRQWFIDRNSYGIGTIKTNANECSVLTADDTAIEANIIQTAYLWTPIDVNAPGGVMILSCRPPLQMAESGTVGAKTDDLNWEIVVVNEVLSRSSEFEFRRGQSAESNTAPAKPDLLSKNPLAEKIVLDALCAYRRPDGYEGYLVEAAHELKDMGREAWSALMWIARSGIPECEYFVSVIVAMTNISSYERLTALLALARNEDSNTRSRLLEHLWDLSDADRRDVLTTLVESGRPDDAVTERAKEIMAGFE